MANEDKVIATAGLVSVAVGSANSIVKYKTPPSSRFLIGSGVAYLILTAMTASEALGELAKGIAVGIMTTIVLGEGGGVMSYFVGKQEQDTTAPKPQTGDKGKQKHEATHTVAHLRPSPTGQYNRDRVGAQPFLPGH